MRMNDNKNAPPAAPLVTVRIISAPNDALLIGVVSHDNGAHRGGLIRLTPAALAALPGELLNALARHNAEQRQRAA
jgi:hypothetical protein